MVSMEANVDLLDDLAKRYEGYLVRVPHGLDWIATGCRAVTPGLVLYRVSLPSGRLVMAPADRVEAWLRPWCVPAGAPCEDQVDTWIEEFERASPGFADLVELARRRQRRAW